MNIFDNINDVIAVGQIPPNSIINADCLDVMKYIKSELLNEKIKMQKKTERQEKQQKEMKKKTNKKYHYLYDERTMRKEKLIKLK